MNQIVEAFWGTSTRKWITSTSAAIVGIATVMTTVVVPAYTYYELPVPASQRFVQHVLTPVELAQNEQRAAIDQLLLFQLYQQLDLASKDPAAATSPIVQQRIREIQQQIADTQARINSSSRR